MSKIFIIPIIFLFSLSFVNAQKKTTIDVNSTKETKALFKNLYKLAKKHTLFGHQHATEYGHGWSGDADRSDVKSVVGSHPAVIGIDIAGLSGASREEIERTKKKLKKNVVDTYNRGGVTTISWHFPNPVSGGGFYWKDSVSLPAVKYIIPGGTSTKNTRIFLKTLQIGQIALKEMTEN